MLFCPPSQFYKAINMVIVVILVRVELDMV